MGPDGEDALVAFLRTRLDGWNSQLSRYKTLADTGQYPGQADISDGLTLIKALLACEESYTFIERFNERKDDLLDFADSYHDLDHFYEHQKPTWDRLRMAYTTYTLNRAQLEHDAQAAAALRRMQDILTATSPYSLIQEATSLITTVEGVNATLLAQHRTATCQKIDDVMAALTKDIALVHGDEALTSVCLGPLAKAPGPGRRRGQYCPHRPGRTAGADVLGYGPGAHPGICQEGAGETVWAGNRSCITAAQTASQESAPDQTSGAG